MGDDAPTPTPVSTPSCAFIDSTFPGFRGQLDAIVLRLFAGVHADIMFVG